MVEKKQSANQAMLPRSMIKLPYLSPEESDKWLWRLAFYCVYYFCCYLLFISYRGAYSMMKGINENGAKPFTQARMDSPRMTIFPVDYVREANSKSYYDANPRSNHIELKNGALLTEYNNIMNKKLDNMENKDWVKDVRQFCWNGKGYEQPTGLNHVCFLVSISTVIGWKPIPLNATDGKYSMSTVNVEGEDKAFDLESQGFKSNTLESETAGVHFNCMAFPTILKNGNVIPDDQADPIEIPDGLITWYGEASLEKRWFPYNGHSGGAHKELPEDKNKCRQPGLIQGYNKFECNVVEFPYKGWSKPYAVMKIDMEKWNEADAKYGANFKCHAYAENIKTPMFDKDSATKAWYMGDIGSPATKYIHQSFTIQHKNVEVEEEVIEV